MKWKAYVDLYPMYIIKEEYDELIKEYQRVVHAITSDIDNQIKLLKYGNVIIRHYRDD